VAFVLIVPQDPLWLNWNGTREKGIGRKVQRFYIRTLGLDVTTTRIRSLLETVATELHERGDISLGAKNAVANCNGHSAAIAQSHYLRSNMVSSVYQGRQVFEVFLYISIVLHSLSWFVYFASGMQESRGRISPTAGAGFDTLH
jgi:hypothetical protein